MIHSLLLILLLSILMVGCTPATPLTTTPPTTMPLTATPPTTMASPSPDLERQITDAHCFLAARYAPEYGLLQESPITAPNRFWLATDNRLAVYALRAIGDAEHAAQIEAAIAVHPENKHGLIEALIGEDVVWPPRTETQSPIDGDIWNEQRLTGPQYEDWQVYADLALYAALDTHNAGNGSQSAALYHQAMALFDGVGFADKSYTSPAGHGLYAT